MSDPTQDTASEAEIAIANVTESANVTATTLITGNEREKGIDLVAEEETARENVKEKGTIEIAMVRKVPPNLALEFLVQGKRLLK